MSSKQIQQIKDGELRGLLEQAESMLDAGDNSACVHACGEAYLMLLQKHPPVLTGLRAVLATPRVRAGLENGTLRFAPLMFPRLAAKLSVPDEGTSTLTYTREQMGFGEAVQYYEFTVTLIADAEQGIISTGEGSGGS